MRTYWTIAHLTEDGSWTVSAYYRETQFWTETATRLLSGMYLCEHAIGQHRKRHESEPASDGEMFGDIPF